MDIERLKTDAGVSKGTRTAKLTGLIINYIETKGSITRAIAIRINCMNYGVKDIRYMPAGVPVMVDKVIRTLIGLGYIYKKEPGFYIKVTKQD